MYKCLPLLVFTRENRVYSCAGTVQTYPECIKYVNILISVKEEKRGKLVLSTLYSYVHSSSLDSRTRVCWVTTEEKSIYTEFMKVFLLLGILLLKHSTLREVLNSYFSKITPYLPYKLSLNVYSVTVSVFLLTTFKGTCIFTVTRSTKTSVYPVVLFTVIGTPVRLCFNFTEVCSRTWRHSSNNLVFCKDLVVTM